MKVSLNMDEVDKLLKEYGEYLFPAKKITTVILLDDNGDETFDYSAVIEVGDNDE